MPATLFDAVNKSSSTTLSGGSLTATGVTASFNAAVAATRCFTGKTYFEITPSTFSGVVSIGFGARQRFTFFAAAPSLLGSDIHSVGFRNNGTVLINALTVSTIQSYVAGNVVQVALDPTVFPYQVWFNVNNGNWNNNAANNPATGVGGIALTTLTGGLALLPAWSAAPTSPAPVATAAFSSGGWSFSAPSGFSSPDTCQAVGFNASAVIGASFTSISAARKDPITTTKQASYLPVAAGAFFGSHTRVWSPAATAKTITGTVTQGGAPVAAIVQLYDKVSGDLLYQTVSSAVDGSYSFADLNPAITYDVIAHDLPNFDALIHDNVSPA